MIFLIQLSCYVSGDCLQHIQVFILVTVDLENWNGTDRHHFNAIVPDQDLVEVSGL